MGSMLSYVRDLPSGRGLLAVLVLAAGVVGRQLLKNLPAIWAIINADKAKRYRVCLEVMRLRRPDAPELPSYLPDDAPEP